MATNNETRNRMKKMHGVTGSPGGRHDSTPRQPAGGGYQNICAKIEAALTPPASDAVGVDDLRRIGLSRAWVDVAEAIGYAAFMKVWRVLAGHQSLDDRGRLVVPLFTGLVRYRRNEFVRDLIAQGADDAYIVSAVKRRFWESLMAQQLRRLRATSKVRA